jgi:hypothetical protein
MGLAIDAGKGLPEETASLRLCLSIYSKQYQLVN